MKHLVNAGDSAEAIARALDTDELRTTLDVIAWWLTDDRLTDASAERMRTARDTVRDELARRTKGARHDA